MDPAAVVCGLRYNFATGWQQLDQAQDACSMTATAGLAAKVHSRTLQQTGSKGT